MMARTQITLDSETHRQATHKAAQLRLSLSGYIRQLISRDVDNEVPRADPSIIFNLVRTKGSDIAGNKRKVIGEAFDAANPRVK